MVQIAPSIICADFARLGEEVAALEAAGADLLHFDVMDGHFVPNITIGVLHLEALRELTELPFETHLMVREPDHLIESYIIAGSARIIVHVEACTHLLRTLQYIRSFEDTETGVALNPATPVAALEPVLEFIDQVTVMTVNPGFAGQPFIRAMLRKVEQLRMLIDAHDLDTQIEVDGGLSPENIGDIVSAGASVVVGGGSSVFVNGKDYAAAIAGLRRHAE
ncbi:MAG: ribulose-phosphate 3-epimerase [Fimbriimonadaceae bacterium]|nr:ribulose-phosphate 3-epimerase [Fimbriimonadaceae bacterium]